MLNARIIDLVFADYNPRKISEQEMESLKRSIKEFGFVQPVVVNQFAGRENVVIGGHQRITAAKELGIEEIPVIYISLDPEKEKALNLALNRISGEWDESKLSSIISEMRGSDILPTTGFAENEISKILDSMMPDITDENEIGELPELNEPESQPGEVYELGNHRLICGDSTDPETYKKIMIDLHCPHCNHLNNIGDGGKI